jgi:hypothetical protein
MYGPDQSSLPDGSVLPERAVQKIRAQTPDTGKPNTS